MLSLNHDCCCSVTKLCPALCNSMDWSTPGFPVLHYLQVCSDSCPLSSWCHPTISSSLPPFSSCLQSLPASGSFPRSWLFASGGQSSGASAAASVLPMNIQGWFPLGWTHLISLRSKGVSKVFSSTTIKRHRFFNAQPSLWSNSNHWTAREVPMYVFIGLKHSNFHEGLLFPQCLGSAGLVNRGGLPLPSHKTKLGQVTDAGLSLLYSQGDHSKYHRCSE